MMALSAASLGMQSCVNDMGDCPPEEVVKEDGFHLRFTIMTRNDARTRAADIEGEQEGAGYENFLDIKDIKYLIFDKDLKFITDITAKTETVAANANYTVYNVVANVDDQYFYDNLNGIVDFYILCLANHGGWGITIPELNRGDNLGDLFSDGLVMTTTPVTSLLQYALYDVGQKFPMSGLQHFRVSGSMLMTSAEGAPYDLSLAAGKDLNLLRALAKIEIIDKINIKEGTAFDEGYDNDNINGNGRFRIDKVELNGFMTRGTLLPNIYQWDRNSVFETQQVMAPTIPTSSEYKLPPVLNADNSFGSSDGFSGFILDFIEDDYASSLRKDKCPVFSGYVYEYLKTSDQMNGVPATQQPYFRVTTRGYTSPDGLVEAESMIFPVRMAAYTNGTATSANNLPQLLRNHIYRFEIAGIGQDITVNWTVCEMDNASADIEFN